MVFCYQNCADLLWKKIVLAIEKNCFLRSLEQFIQNDIWENFSRHIPIFNRKKKWSDFDIDCFLISTKNDLNSWFTTLYICRILFETWKIFPLCIVPSSSSNSFQLSYSVKSNEKGFFAQIRRELLKGKISIIYSPDPTTNSNTMDPEFSKIYRIISNFSCWSKKLFWNWSLYPVSKILN